TTSNKPLMTPADVAGLKLRLPTVPTWMAVWREMGAEPIPIPLTGLFAALQEGRAEASEGDLTQISSFRLNEVQTHLTMTNHLVMTGGMMINTNFLASLSRRDQTLITKAVEEASQWASDRFMATEASILADLKQRGMQIVVPDAAAFRAKGKPAVEALFRTEWPVTTWESVLGK
ncbi:MAG TPA: TRAP transporter substrate-binding protein, partial [Magnetospirillaceae bacterium]|nr:TRAP transporter substrate-binding protein [Magnetospirillaceae bacterium]